MILCVRVILLSVLYISQQCSCARILGIFQVPSVSHQLAYESLMRALALRGHELVVMTTDGRLYENSPNTTIIDVSEVSYRTFRSKFNLRSAKKGNTHLLTILKSMMIDVVDAQFSSTGMRAILGNERQHFDLVFVESLQQSVMPIGAYFKAPLIGISSTLGMLSNLHAVKNPIQPIPYPDAFRVCGEDLNIWQKIDTIYAYLWQLYTDWVFSSESNRIARKHFGVNTLSVEEAERRMALLFQLVNPFFTGIRPSVPAAFLLGGIHIKPSNILPKELKTFLDRSSQGVIYMSFGSNIKCKDMPQQKLNMFLETFQELPYNIVWKWENDTLSGKPRNVFTAKWLPQQELLGHQNVKLFIGQGGQQSLDEAIFNKVPVIGIPFLSDQFNNVDKIRKYNIGKGLNFRTLNKEEFKNNIIEVITNEKYKVNMNIISNILRDESKSGIEKAVWWTEYVLRHKGAKHLQAPEVSLYEYIMLDVILFVSLLIVLVFLLGAFFRYLVAIISVDYIFNTVCSSAAYLKSVLYCEQKE